MNFDYGSLLEAGWMRVPYELWRALVDAALSTESLSADYRRALMLTDAVGTAQATHYRRERFPSTRVLGNRWGVGHTTVCRLLTHDDFRSNLQITGVPEPRPRRPDAGGPEAVQDRSTPGPKAVQPDQDESRQSQPDGPEAVQRRSKTGPEADTRALGVDQTEEEDPDHRSKGDPSGQAVGEGTGPAQAALFDTDTDTDTDTDEIHHEGVYDDGSSVSETSVARGETRAAAKGRIRGLQVTELLTIFGQQVRPTLANSKGGRRGRASPKSYSAAVRQAVRATIDRYEDDPDEDYGYEDIKSALMLVANEHPDTDWIRNPQTRGPNGQLYTNSWFNPGKLFSTKPSEQRYRDRLRALMDLTRAKKAKTLSAEDQAYEDREAERQRLEAEHERRWQEDNRRRRAAYLARQKQEEEERQRTLERRRAELLKEQRTKLLGGGNHGS